MKYRGKKIITGILICILSGAMCNITFAHSGRTDSKGGHKDKNNASGLGSYHYHCGGYPAHLHTNGVCPYSSSSTKIEVKSIKINENIKEIKVGDSKELSTSILPENATNKEITWETSDKDVIEIKIVLMKLQILV